MVLLWHPGVVCCSLAWKPEGLNESAVLRPSDILRTRCDEEIRGVGSQGHGSVYCHSLRVDEFLSTTASY